MTQHPAGSYNVHVPFITTASTIVSFPGRMSPAPIAGFRVKGVTGEFTSATPLQHIRIVSKMLTSYGSEYAQTVWDQATGVLQRTSVIAVVSTDAAGNFGTQPALVDSPLVLFNRPVQLVTFDLSVQNHLGVDLPVTAGNDVWVHLELIQCPSLDHH